MSWFRTERERPEPTPVLEYRAPPGTQTIDNSEEFESFRDMSRKGRVRSREGTATSDATSDTSI